MTTFCLSSQAIEVDTLIAGAPLRSEPKSQEAFEIFLASHIPNIDFKAYWSMVEIVLEQGPSKELTAIRLKKNISFHWTCMPA